MSDRTENPFGEGAVVGVFVTLFVVLVLVMMWHPDQRADDELCPPLLALSTTAADSLALFQEHGRCFRYVQRTSP